MWRRRIIPAAIRASGSTELSWLETSSTAPGSLELLEAMHLQPDPDFQRRGDDDQIPEQAFSGSPVAARHRRRLEEGPSAGGPPRRAARLSRRASAVCDRSSALREHPPSGPVPRQQSGARNEIQRGPEGALADQRPHADQDGVDRRVQGGVAAQQEAMHACGAPLAAPAARSRAGGARADPTAAGRARLGAGAVCLPRAHLELVGARGGPRRSGGAATEPPRARAPRLTP